MTKEFWKAALIRALRTFCQTALGMFGASTLIEEINWLAVLSASAFAAIASILTSVATGLPEAKNSDK